VVGAQRPQAVDRRVAVAAAGLAAHAQRGLGVGGGVGLEPRAVVEEGWGVGAMGRCTDASRGKVSSWGTLHTLTCV
jgi:hypothetical protein